MSPNRVREEQQLRPRQVIACRGRAGGRPRLPLRHHQVASQQQAAADTAQRRLLAQEQAYDPSAPPAQAPAPTRAAEPSGQPDWLVASLGVLAAALALVGGLALLAAKRASRRARVRHAA
jgi:hypothetical protein